MAGEHDAAVDPGSDRGQDRRLVAGRIRRAARLEPMRAQIGLDEVDERQVGPVADAVEGDEPRQQRLGLGETALRAPISRAWRAKSPRRARGD